MTEAINAQMAALGCGILDNSCIPFLLSELTADSFTDEKCRKVFETMVRLDGEGKPIDLTTLEDALVNSVPDGYMLDMVDKAITPLNVRGYVASIQDAHRGRIVERGLMCALSEVRNGAGDPIATAQAAIDAANTMGAGDVQTIGTYAAEAIMRLWENPEKTLTGFGALDRTLNGLHGGDLLILAARPSVGKTALAMNIATNVARQGKPVAVFELEMSLESLIQRNACSMARVSRDQILMKDAKAVERMEAAMREMDPLPLYINDSGNINVSKIKSICYSIRQRRGLGLIVVDYLGLIQTKARKNGTKEQEIAELSRSFKLLAREMDCPVLLLAQLNRAVESREGGRPQLSDLRDSGAIEQDADAVLLLYRGMDSPQDKSATLRIAKNRNGETGEIGLVFHGEHFLFQSRAYAGK